MKPTLKIGLITGTISIVFLFGSFTLCTWLNSKYGWGIAASTFRGIGGLLSIPIQAIGIYMAMQDVKKTSGSLTYGQAVKTGLTVAFTIALLVALFSFIYCQFLNPGYAAYMMNDAKKQMLANGDTPAEVHANSVKVAAQFTTGAQVMMALVGQFFTGAIMSLIIGLFAKKGR